MTSHCRVLLFVLLLPALAHARRPDDKPLVALFTQFIGPAVKTEEVTVFESGRVVETSSDRTVSADATPQLRCAAKQLSPEQLTQLRNLIREHSFVKLPRFIASESSIDGPFRAITVGAPPKARRVQWALRETADRAAEAARFDSIWRAFSSC